MSVVTPMVMPARRETPPCRWHRYPSLDAAEQALQQCRAAAADPRRQETRVYACQHCRGFHLARDSGAAGCPSGKRAYPTAELAQAALTRIWSRPANTPGQLPAHTYQCPHHQNEVWHLTSKDQGERTA